MKRITKADINFIVDTKLIKVDDFSIKFYTVNPTNFYISKNQDNVIQDGDNYVIKLDWNELVTIGEGVLEYRAINNTIDNGYVDNYYNKSVERTTEYYINSDIVVDEDEAKNYGELIAELGQEIAAEVSTRQQNVSDLTDLITAETNRAASAETAIDDKFDNVYTKSEVYNKSEVDTIIENIDVSDQLVNYTPLSSFTAFSGEVITNEEIVSSALNDLESRKADISAVTDQYNILNDKINQEVLDRELIDTSLSRRINNKLDASAYTPTDLTSYYTKSETDNLVNGETSRAVSAETLLNGLINTNTQNISTISGNTYTKTEVDQKIEDIDVSGQLKDYVTISAFTMSAKTINDKIDTKADKTALNTKVSQAAFDTYSADTVVAIENKASVDDLHEVAFSGDYNDLKNKPSVSPSLPEYWDAGEY